MINSKAQIGNSIFILFNKTRLTGMWSDNLSQTAYRWDIGNIA